jgi:hypothetical protein
MELIRGNLLIKIHHPISAGVMIRARNHFLFGLFVGKKVWLPLNQKSQAGARPIFPRIDLSVATKK